MKIRSRLTFQFAIIVAAILILFSGSIYYFSADYRKQQFNSRLRDRALTAVRLLVDIKQVDKNLLKIIDKTTTAPPSELIQIFNSQFVEIYRSSDNIYLDINTNEILSKLIQQNETTLECKEKDVLGIKYSSLNNDYYVIASAYDKYGISKLVYLKILLIVMLLISVSLTVFAGWFYSGQAIAPIQNVINQVEKITHANMNLRVNEGNGKDEIAELAITFNKMLERLSAAFEMQRSFVSNASHELRTPLTSIMAQIDVTLLTKRDINEYESILKSMLDDIRSLSSLINGLLNMTSVELDYSEFKFNPTRIDEVLWQAQSDISKSHKDYQINIEFSDIPTDDRLFLVNGNDHLLKTVFTNLMENACKYSEDKKVSVILSLDGNYVVLKFKDNGIGIDRENIEKIFQPFFRIETIKGISGHGLGLSITQRIVKLLKGYIAIESKVNHGTTVIVAIPIIPIS